MFGLTLMHTGRFAVDKLLFAIVAQCGMVALRVAGLPDTTGFAIPVLVISSGVLMGCVGVKLCER